MHERRSFFKRAHKGRSVEKKCTLEQGSPVVHQLVGNHLVGGADTPRVSQHVQVGDVSPTVTPDHPHRHICKGQAGRQCYVVTW